MTREQALKAIWKKTPKDYKGIYEGRKCIMTMRPAGSSLVPLDMLTDAEIKNRVAEYVA